MKLSEARIPMSLGRRWVPLPPRTLGRLLGGQLATIRDWERPLQGNNIFTFKKHPPGFLPLLKGFFHLIQQDLLQGKLDHAFFNQQQKQSCARFAYSDMFLTSTSFFFWGYYALSKTTTKHSLPAKLLGPCKSQEAQKSEKTMYRMGKDIVKW